MGLGEPLRDLPGRLGTVGSAIDTLTPYGSQLDCGVLHLERAGCPRRLLDQQRDALVRKVRGSVTPTRAGHWRPALSRCSARSSTRRCGSSGGSRGVQVALDSVAKALGVIVTKNEREPALAAW